jgi:hypothetical protein
VIISAETVELRLHVGGIHVGATLAFGELGSFNQSVNQNSFTAKRSTKRSK